ncbi:MAG: DUF72 domain-containing protein [Chloroflexota bacterium]
MSDATGTVKIGCCGFARSRGEYYGTFRLVEVQKTFYKLPRLATARRWRQEAPEDFEFTIKAPQLITHPPSSPTYRKAGLKLSSEDKPRYGFFKPTQEVFQARDNILEFARVLESHVIVFQCPPSFGESEEHIQNLRRFFQPVKGSGYVLAWEPRRGWSEQTIGKLCGELDLVHCVDPMVSHSLCGTPPYYRLHGGEQYRHRFPDDELRELRQKVHGTDSYVLFNNLNMFNDALSFQRLMEEQEG